MSEKQLGGADASIECVECGHGGSTVIDTRRSDKRNGIRRRRICEKCGTRYTTYEFIDTRNELMALIRSAVHRIKQETAILESLTEDWAPAKNTEDPGMRDESGGSRRKHTRIGSGRES